MPPTIHDLADLSEAEIERRMQQGVPPIPARHMREIEKRGLRMVEMPLDAFADDSECVEDMMGSWSHEPIREHSTGGAWGIAIMFVVAAFIGFWLAVGRS
jgi:hypothetical protein